MSANPERSLYAHVQPRGSNEAIDIYRVVRGEGAIRQENFVSPEAAGVSLQERTRMSLSNLGESEMFLGLSTAVTAVLFIESMRKRSGVLALAGFVSGVVALNENRRRLMHREELDWLDRESIAAEVYDDSRPSLTLVK